MAAFCPDHHDLVHHLQRSLLLFFGQLFTLTKAGVVVVCFYITGASRSSHLCIASIYRVRHLECTQRAHSIMGKTDGKQPIVIWCDE